MIEAEVEIEIIVEDLGRAEKSVPLEIEMGVTLEIEVRRDVISLGGVKRRERDHFFHSELCSVSLKQNTFFLRKHKL